MIERLCTRMVTTRNILMGIVGAQVVTGELQREGGRWICTAIVTTIQRITAHIDVNVVTIPVEEDE